MKSRKRLSISLLLSLILIMLLSFSAAAAAPKKVTGLKATTSKTTIKLTWNKVTNAAGYEVYQVNKSTGDIKLLKKTTKLALSIKNCKYNTTYRFKVRAYNSDKEYGAFSSVVSATPKVAKPNTPKYFRLQSRGDKSATLRWSVMSGITGYVLEMYDSATDSYVIKKTMTSPKTKSVTVKNLKAGKTYKFRIRSYKTVGGEPVYSKPSDAVSVKIIAYSDALKQVRNAYYVVKTKKAVTCTNKETKEKISLKKGTKLYVTAKNGTTVSGYLKNGTPIKIKRAYLKYVGLDSSPKNDYSKSVKEDFVNLKKFKSSTEYLIWVSQAKVTVNVFQGSQGKWKLVKEFPCCVGAWATRSAQGYHKILKTVANGDYNGPWLYFSSGEGTPAEPEGCAFHNQPTSDMSKAVSHGCIRMRLSDLTWLYNHCAVGTTVYVY